MLVLGDMENSIEIIAAASGELGTAAELRRVMAVEMGDDWDGYPGWPARFVEYLRRRQEAGDLQVFFARSGEEIIGMATVSLIDDYHAYTRGKLAGRVNAVYVLPAYRRRGVALASTSAAMNWLREKGCIAVRLHSSENAVSFYESLGFKSRREMERPLE